MEREKTVVVGLLGTQLDAADGPTRWDRWRPTVALGRMDDFVMDRLDLLYDRQFLAIAERVQADLALVSPETEVVLHDVGFRDPWNFEEVYQRLYDFFEEYKFEDDAEYLAHLTTGTHVAQICLFLLTEARFFPGKLLQNSPGKDRRGRGPSGLGERQVIDLDLSKYDLIQTRFAREQAEGQDFLKSGIATKNAAFNRLIEELEVVAVRSKAPILLTGPTGAGKSQLAGKVYELRCDRAGLEGDFVEVNCATLRGDTAMSTLFGHKKGAFTGAMSDRPGLLRQANKGLLFLDEIGELGLDEQAMLLRALEEGVFLPMGSDTPVKSRFQLMAGTNRDLREEVAAGTFREDLFARINLWAFELPGLRDRREDIAPNLAFETKKFAQREGRALAFNKEAAERFLAFACSEKAAWSGNFRDLNAAVMRMGTLAPRGRVRVEEVEAEIARLQAQWPDGEGKSQSEEVDLEGLGVGEIDSFDRVQLAHVVAVCQRSKSMSEAGRALFAVSRAKKANPNDSDRVRKFLAKFGLTFDQIHEAG